MLKYICKTNEEYYIKSLAEVKDFHKELEDDSVAQDYNLSGFSWTEKPIKESGETIDSYFIVKVVKIFDDPKDPAGVPLKEVRYTHTNEED